MIANPANYFINGDETKEFTYQGGTKPYHFSPYDSGLSRSMEMSIMLFADSPAHAKEILTDLLYFKIDCMMEYIENKITSPLSSSGFSKEDKIVRCRELLKHKDQWKFTQAPTNQVYKISWAGNDTI